jgi:peptidoglycan hydrolase-like protein with peptidoglycan-binding domain
MLSRNGIVRIESGLWRLSAIMMTTRILIVSAALGATTLAGPMPAGATAPPAPPACAAVPEGATFLVAIESDVALVRSTGNEPLGLMLPAPVHRAVRGPDGTVWAETTGTEGDEVYRIPAGGEPALSAGGEIDLHSAGWLDGRTAAVIVDRANPLGAEEFGAVRVEFADGEQVDVKIAGAPEYSVHSVTIGAGRLAEGAWTDLTEGVGYYDAEGDALSDWFDPTESATYNAPPLFQWPVAAVADDPAAAVLSWVEGPDWNGATNQVEGGWALVVADASTGAEALRLDLGEAGDALVHADFDGRFWVGTFDITPDPGTEPTPLVAERILVVDTEAAEPAVVDAGCPAGLIATLDRKGAPEPPSADAPAETTTTVTPATAPPTSASRPTTTTTPPPACATYGPNDRYPIRLCDEGPAVLVVQRALVAAGHQLDADGYFGPGTEAEVRRFQQAHGLEVDGLVGHNTWAALIQFAPPSGTDADGSGVIDPWETGEGGLGEVPDTAAEAVGFEFGYVDVNGVVLAVDETPIPDITNLEGWGIAGDGAGLGTSGLSAFHMRVGGNDMLWTATLLFDPDTERVNDAVDLDLAAGQGVSRTCVLDGTPVGPVQTIDDIAVFGVVDNEATEQSPVSRAFSINVPEGDITELDAARVTCAAD